MEHLAVLLLTPAPATSLEANEQNSHLDGGGDAHAQSGMRGNALLRKTLVSKIIETSVHSAAESHRHERNGCEA